LRVHIVFFIIADLRFLVNKKQKNGKKRIVFILYFYIACQVVDTPVFKDFSKK